MSLLHWGSAVVLVSTKTARRTKTAFPRPTAAPLTSGRTSLVASITRKRHSNAKKTSSARLITTAGIIPQRTSKVIYLRRGKGRKRVTNQSPKKHACHYTRLNYSPSLVGLRRRKIRTLSKTTSGMESSAKVVWHTTPRKILQSALRSMRCTKGRVEERCQCPTSAIRNSLTKNVNWLSLPRSSIWKSRKTVN
jgi:hypothetical protein